jgi:hypothetical protein
LAHISVGGKRSVDFIKTKGVQRKIAKIDYSLSDRIGDFQSFFFNSSQE